MKSTALIVLVSCLGLARPLSSDAASTPTMNSSAPAGYRYVTLAPEGRAFLHSRVLLGDDFKLADLPAEEIDFSNPARFMPLGVAMTAYGPLVLSVAARPAYEDGAVSQWLAYLCKEEGYEAGAPEIVQVGSLQGVAVEATQAGNGITMRMRLVLVENGGRLFQMTAMAPTELWSAVAGKLQTMLASFEPAEVREPRAALFPGGTVPVIASAATGESNSEPSVVTVADQPVADPVPTAKLTDAEFAELVLAPDASALDPEHQINANLRDRGAGLAVRVLSLDAQKKSARVGAGAIEAVFTVPFGWHVIDDGRRTLVFDGAGRMQINLNVRSRDGESLLDLGRGYLADYVAKQPELEALTFELENISAVVLRGIEIDGEILDQTFLMREIPGTGRVLVARVTGKREDIRLAMNLAGDILSRIELKAELAANR